MVSLSCLLDYIWNLHGNRVYLQEYFQKVLKSKDPPGMGPWRSTWNGAGEDPPGMGV